MASNTMAITVPASSLSLSSDGVSLGAIRSLLCILNVSTASTGTSMGRSRSAIEVVEIPAKIPLTTVWSPVVADTVSATTAALPPVEFTFAASSGNTSDTENTSKGPESEKNDDEYWLREYAKRHRKRPGSSAARRLERRLLVLQQVSAKLKSSVAASEESTEEVLLSLYRALLTEESKGEALSGPPLPSQERAGLSETSSEKLFPRDIHSASYPPTGIDAISPESTKELAREVEKRFHPGQKSTLPSPNSAEIRRNEKKNPTGKPRARKPSAPRREKKTVGVEGKSKVMVAKVEKKPYVTHSGRLVKKTHKMEEVARCFLASF